MDAAMAAAVWPVELEVRARGRRRRLVGAFPYNREAVVSDRGRVRKERFRTGAFSWQVKRFAELQDQLAKMIQEEVEGAYREALMRELAARNVDLLRGHNFDRPIASMLGGSLKLKDTNAALRFEANLPENPPSWIDDTLKAVDAGLIRGVSPGFASRRRARLRMPRS